MRKMTWMMVAVAFASAAALVGCGGGGADAGTSLNPGSSGGSAVSANDLAVVLSANTLPNDGSSTVTATVTALDANRNALAGAPVTVSADNGAIVTASSASTGADGTLAVTVSAGSDLSNRTVNLSVKSGSLKQAAALQVTGAKISGSVPSSLTAGQSILTTYTLLNASSKPMALQPYTLTTITGAVVTGTTDANGAFVYTDTVPASYAGAYTVTAAAAGASASQTVNVSPASSSVPPATGSVLSASLATGATVVNTNANGSTSNSVELRALFLGGNNLPVQNIRVRFDLNGDANSIGGSLTSGAATVYSDASGVARTTYVPADRSSPTNGLTLRACWSNSDFSVGQCPNQAIAQITVADEPLSVSIGTSGSITSGENEDYIVHYLVQVVDSAGRAKKDVTITPSIDLLRYEKGYYDVQLDTQGAYYWAKHVMSSCDNEDLNRNGVAETLTDDSGTPFFEDINASYDAALGSPALQPRKADAAVSVVNSALTDENGQVVLQVHYPRNVASWVVYNLMVSASGVSGTEGRANYSNHLAVPATVISDSSTPPPFVASPYGTAVSPLRAITYHGTTYSLCTSNK